MMLSSDAVRVFVDQAFALPDTLNSFQTKCEACLKLLQRLSPVFLQLQIVQPGGSQPLSSVSVERAAQIRNACAELGRREDYLRAGPDGRIEADTLNKIGFSVALENEEQATNSRVYVRLCGVSANGRGAARSIIDVPVSLGKDTQFVREILRCLLDTFGGTKGGVIRIAYQSRITRTVDAQDAGAWMLFFSRPQLVACFPSTIRRERFGTGELILTMPEIPDPEKESDIQAGYELCAALEEFGLLRWCGHVINGWGPDNEHQQYEHYITGAPAGRKYVVHCVDFDGWDPDRKVLLYAKLFGELKETPKQWGLRGLDEPVINEAQRQVRAAAKAGGVPIEWHIGLEEPARRARYLIEHHTNIKEHQLKVVYNPMPASLMNQGGTQQ